VGVPWDTAQPGQACTLNVASSKTNTRMHRGAARQDACKERWRPCPPLRTNTMCFSLSMQAENAAGLKHIVECKADASRDRAQCMHAVNSCIKHESHAPAACQDRHDLQETQQTSGRRCADTLCSNSDNLSTSKGNDGYPAHSCQLLENITKHQNPASDWNRQHSCSVHVQRCTNDQLL
jgi:hypothetical protein